MTLVLVVDDAAPLAEQYAYDLRRMGGYEVLTAPDGTKALELIAGAPVDCVILDLEMPGMDGFEVLRVLERKGIPVPVIVYTGTGNYERCVQAVRLGAYGFVDKAEPVARVVQEIESALERRRLRGELLSLRRQLGRETSLVGSSAAMGTLRETIARVAPIPSPVLIMGESGTGKELVARDLHRLGPNPSGPFVPLNSAALPESLVESELFGHERGAFTGATTSYAGAFERAHGGTVFLDEIGELPLAMQPKLLRVLERKEVRRVGASKPIEVDLRVVAATNRDLGVEVNRGRFREDLYYRLAVARVHVPPLRERKDDLRLLIEHILTTTPNGETASIAQETIDLMMKHDWPGNVRELRNVIERAVLLAETPEDEDALRRTPAAAPRGEPSITATPSHTATSSDAAMTVPVDVGIPFKLAKQNVISEFEKRYISRLLAQHDGNISAAARAAGIDRMSIHKMLHRLGLSNPGRE